MSYTLRGLRSDQQTNSRVLRRYPTSSASVGAAREDASKDLTHALQQWDRNGNPPRGTCARPVAAWPEMQL
jgi:hypothetical protein